MKRKLQAAEYARFLNQVKERIRSAQYEALKAVNRELIRLYWDLGKMIVERQEKQGWGKAVVETLARDLQKEFPERIMHGVVKAANSKTFPASANPPRSMKSVNTAIF